PEPRQGVGAGLAGAQRYLALGGPASHQNGDVFAHLSSAATLIRLYHSRGRGWVRIEHLGALSPSPPGAKRVLCHPDPLDLPLKLDAGMLFAPPTHRLAQRLDVAGAGAAEIDQKIAVHLRHLRIADLQPAAAGSIDELPRFVTGRVLEGRAARAALDRLGGLARFGA